MAPDPFEEAKRKLELTKGTLEHVFSATKHEDEKAGRILTSMAFIATASAAIFSALYSKNSPKSWTIFGGTFNPFTTFFESYIIFLILGTVLMLEGIGPNFNIPKLWKGQSKGQDDKDDAAKYEPTSLYFFEKIAREDLDKWKDYFRTTESTVLYQKAWDDAMFETQLIGDKVHKKVVKIKIAKYLFIIAIVFMLAMVFVGLN